MNMDLDMQLSELIKRTTLTTPENGYKIITLNKDGDITEPSGKFMMAMNLHKKDITHYRIKTEGTPFIMEDIEIEWKEGTKKLGLTFLANFQILVGVNKGKNHAENLAKKLHHSTSLYQGLYDIIKKFLNVEMSKIYDEYTGKDSQNNLMDEFSNNGVLTNESENLNQNTSKKIQEALGVESFRIGFKLKNKPIMQLRLEHLTTFKAKNEDEKDVESQALLILNNFQAFEKSELKSKSDIKNMISDAIDTSINKHFFGKSLIEIAEKFKNKEQSINNLIKKDVELVANNIGYDLKLFSALPKIPILDLIEGQRIEVESEDGYLRTKNSTGNVKINIVLEAKAQPKNLNKLNSLINSEPEHIEESIKKNLLSICKDEIIKIDRKLFNLHFDTQVAPVLENAIDIHLGKRYGLDISIINLSQLPTEDAERFNRILKKTKEFEFTIEPQALSGHGYTVDMLGVFEVISIAENDGWDNFESKDFGFKSNSIEWSSEEKLLIEQEANANQGSREYELVRKRKAIEKELNEIANRISSLLKGKFSKIPNADEFTRALEHDKEFTNSAESYAKDVIENEFGLTIKLRELNRKKLTPGEILNQEAFESIQKSETSRHITHHKMITEFNKANLQRLQNLLVQKEELTKAQLSNEDNPFAEDLSEKLNNINDEIESLTGVEKDFYKLETNSRSSNTGLKNQDFSQSLSQLGLKKDEE